MILKMHRLCLLASFLVISACLFATTDASAEEKKITVYLTVDWEGLSLDDDNLQVIREFRVRYPHIPMLHLINPAYFTRSDIVDANNKILSTLMPIDTVGLHLHGWRSLITACHLPYRMEPSFSDAGENCSDLDCGYTVSLEFAYSESELTELLMCSSGLLRERGFNHPRHFRAGGWQLGPKLTGALQRSGFKWDSSRIPAELLLSKWREESSLIRLIQALHGDADILDQPRELVPGLLQFPNNAGLMDYTSKARLLEVFQLLLDADKSVMVTGFHQETASIYLDDLEEAIIEMKDIADDRGVRLEWGNYD